ncbi:serine protein kinase PrkA [Desulfopila sp. IMCC35006]|uniref:serine protein kinase PrkA n=1 Tax=Desulfopila sp. IMCC35006 TaxID=2569542 RepID=UPI0010ABD49F|nr:serine protein kinase PrkA [Desulfopila sp. IMCC35006]TKB27160.1 serine protein kinase PrkA [Desulfopila sp. IMCC35006]
MRDLSRAMENLDRNKDQLRQSPILSFPDFLQQVIEHPNRIIRNVYQVYSDLIDSLVDDGIDEYDNDPESIRFLKYDCTRLFVEGSDRPFFADRLFANRLMRHVDSFKLGSKQNKIYIFDGPHGSGKSTFLNNLLRSFENYANSPEGSRYEVIWRLKHDHLVGGVHSLNSLTDKLAWVLENDGKTELATEMKCACKSDTDLGGYFDVPCPSHDNPLLLIPKEVRRKFFDDLFEDDVFKWQLFTEKKYEWLFHEEPCTICVSLYQALLQKFRDPQKVMECVCARPYVFNRRLGEGVSVFNPGDRPLRNPIMHNPIIQRSLDSVLADGKHVSYLYSRYAKINNGIYALMDVKSHNTERLMELHNIISDGVHKVEDIEEKVNSLLFALMNPEDKTLLADLRAFSDRVEYINIPYVLDLQTEVDIYRENFGKHIDESFLPRVLHNFARVIIATRLRTKSEAMEEWIGEPEKYAMYCDTNLQLLKMEIFTGYIPKWLAEEDVAQFTAKRRHKIVAESESDGWKGLSGRDSIKLFNEFYSTYAREDKLIDMAMLGKFFRKYCKQDRDILPMGFLDSLLRMYNYTVLQEVKESLYFYNEEQISRDIINYMFAVNFDVGTTEICGFTGERLDITEAFFHRMETRLQIDPKMSVSFRNSVQKSYTTTALPQEMLRDGLPITKTSLYIHLYEKCTHNLKEKVLEPFLKNENFRRAVKDYNQEDFKTYDKKIQNDVHFMMENLQHKYLYSRQGAKEICIYVIDNNLARQFSGLVE